MPPCTSSGRSPPVTASTGRRMSSPPPGRPSCSVAPSTAPTGSPASWSSAVCEPPPSTVTAARSSGRRPSTSSCRGSVDTLVATDVAARGIHVDGVNAVIHFDPPADAKDYVHRSGRTARAGATGVVVSFVTPDKAAAVKSLQRHLDVPMGTTVPDMSSITAVLGDAPKRRPAPDRGPSTVPTAGRGPTRGGRPSQGRRQGKPWKPRPEGARNGQSPATGSSRNGSAGGSSRNGSTVGATPSSNGSAGRASGGSKPVRTGAGPWEQRAKPGKPGKPGKRNRHGKPGAPGSGASSSRRGHSGSSAGGGHGGGDRTAQRAGWGQAGRRRRYAGALSPTPMAPVAQSNVPVAPWPGGVP